MCLNDNTATVYYITFLEISTSTTYNLFSFSDGGGVMFNVASAIFQLFATRTSFLLISKD